MKTLATITGIREKESIAHKPYIQIEFTIKVYKEISKDPRAQWQIDELLKARNLTGTLEDNKTDLMGEQVVVELNNRIYKNHLYPGVNQVLSPEALNLAG